MVSWWADGRGRGHGSALKQVISSRLGSTRAAVASLRLWQRRSRTSTALLCLAAGASLASATVVVTAAPVTAAQDPTAITSTFTFKGHPETFTVPPAVYAVDIVAAGGQGGTSHTGTVGGAGIEVTAQNVAVQPGQQLKVVVGGKGGSAVGGGKIPNYGDGAYNGGADGARGGGGGGGFSSVQAPDGKELVVAGGGGGSSGGVGGPQNPPGTLDGQNGGGSLGTPRGGGGGTLNGGGAGGHNPSPLVGDGKGGGRYGGGKGGVGLLPHGSSGGAGGGGGYFGGGGGAGSEAGGGGGGGAGSSYVSPNVKVVVTPHKGASEVKFIYVRSTTMSVTSKPNPIDVGSTVDYTATVTPVPNGGTVTFEDLNYHRVYPGCAQLPLTGGVATCHAQPPYPGRYLVKATYSGTSDFRGSQGNLTNDQFVMSPTTVSLALAPRSKNPSKVHERVFFLAKVVPQTPTSAYPAGVVWLSIDGHRQFQGTLHASFEVQVPADFDNAGDHTVTATFEGDSYYHGSTSPPLAHQVTAGEHVPTTNSPTTTQSSPPSS
jgi:hypothetical protein